MKKKKIPLIHKLSEACRKFFQNLKITTKIHWVAKCGTYLKINVNEISNSIEKLICGIFSIDFWAMNMVIQLMFLVQPSMVLVAGKVIWIFVSFQLGINIATKTQLLFWVNSEGCWKENVDIFYTVTLSLLLLKYQFWKCMTKSTR